MFKIEFEIIFHLNLKIKCHIFVIESYFLFTLILLFISDLLLKYLYLTESRLSNLIFDLFSPEGVLFSVSLGIPSTYLGLGPHPEQGSTFGLGLDFTQDQLDHQFMHGGRTPVTHKEGISDEYVLERMKDSVIYSDFGSVWGGIKKVLSNLGSKLGYFKNTPGYHVPTPNPETGTASAPKLEAGPTPTPDSEADTGPTTNYESEQTSTPNSEPKSNPGQTSDPEHTQFQCMSDTHNPILLEGEPVLVTEPQDCHKYFMDFAAFADPQLVFMEEARAVFKSKYFRVSCD